MINRYIVIASLFFSAIVPKYVWAYTDQRDGLLVFCQVSTAKKVGYNFERVTHFSPIFELKSSTYDRDMNWNSVSDYEESFGRVSLTGSYSTNSIRGQFSADGSLDAYLPESQRGMPKECALSTSIENVREYMLSRSRSNPVDTQLLKDWRPTPNYQTEWTRVLYFRDLQAPPITLAEGREDASSGGVVTRHQRESQPTPAIANPEAGRSSEERARMRAEDEAQTRIAAEERARAEAEDRARLEAERKSQAEVAALYAQQVEQTKEYLRSEQQKVELFERQQREADARAEAFERVLANQRRIDAEYEASMARHRNCVAGDENACEDIRQGAPLKVSESEQKASTDDDATRCVSSPVVSPSPNFKGMTQAVVLNGCGKPVDVRICLLREGGWNCGVSWGLRPQDSWSHSSFHTLGEVFWDARYSETTEALRRPD